MTDYQPIDCGLHSEYELAIMHRTPLILSWRGNDGLDHLETLLPQDLETCRGEEFLVLLNAAGEQLKVRLDRILAAHRRPSQVFT
ncbi:MAG TPA: transcriptional antiterminator, Rof [Gammaproteobacteria bacterium]|nr:transcriptional antiterminator, Rof [Gammaproteobacteria bacterium]